MSAETQTEDQGHAAIGHAWQWAGPYVLASVREASSAARRFLAEYGMPEEELSAWELILTEAGNNCVLHGDRHPVGKTWKIQMLLAPDRVITRIYDENDSFNWPPSPELPDDDSESGRGIFLIHALTDTRKYTRHAGGNTLTLERKRSPITRADDLEATLEAMTEELSSCYESLSAIFRLTAEARSAQDLSQFAACLLKHLGTITGTDCGMLRIVSQKQLVTLAAHGCEPLPACPVDASPVGPEAAAMLSRQDYWFDASSSNATILSGLVHPFYHEDELMGLISLGRHHSEQPFNAGEVNVVHTFSEFFVQQMLNERHAEESLRSSLARREFELAAAIQHALLPPRLPAIAGISVTGHCESAFSIGGDFYDVIPYGESGYLFVIADVMGKGVAASMIAATTRSNIRAFFEQYDHPAKLLARVARQMRDDLEKLEMFVTIVIGLIDSPTRVIRIVNAGHCPVIVCHPDGNFIEAHPLSPPICLEDEPHFVDYEIPIQDGSRILAYTDGLVDPRNDRPTFATQDDVAEWFAEAAMGSRGIDELKSTLLGRLGTNSNPSTLADDQTFLILGFDTTQQ